MDTEQLISGAEAGRIAGVTRETIRYWRGRGWLRSYPTGLAGAEGYRPSEVRELAASSRPASGWPRGKRRKAGASDDAARA